MRDELARRGWIVNRKRVQRLMRRMGLQATYPRRRTSQPAPGHRTYPYRLRGLNIDRPNQVWAADITYISFFRCSFRVKNVVHHGDYRVL